MNKSMEFKLETLKSGIIGTGLTNAIFNGLAYYLMNRSHGPKMLLDFTIGAAATGFILSLICSGILFATIKAKAKKGKLPETTYDRNDHLLMFFFPRKAFPQLLAISAFVMVEFAVIASGVFGILGYSATGIPLMHGVILHGILCGGMGLTNVYLSWVCRLTSLKEEGVL